MGSERPKRPEPVKKVKREGTCDGTFWPLMRKGDSNTADIICNECAAVIKTIPVADLQRTLREMEFTLDTCIAKCTHCGRDYTITGFSEFSCRYCGKAANFFDSTNIDDAE